MLSYQYRSSHYKGGLVSIPSDLTSYNWKFQTNILGKSNMEVMTRVVMNRVPSEYEFDYEAISMIFYS